MSIRFWALLFVCSSFAYNHCAQDIAEQSPVVDANYYGLAYKRLYEGLSSVVPQDQKVGFFSEVMATDCLALRCDIERNLEQVLHLNPRNISGANPDILRGDGNVEGPCALAKRDVREAYKREFPYVIAPSDNKVAVSIVDNRILVNEALYNVIPQGKRRAHILEAVGFLSDDATKKCELVEYVFEDREKDSLFLEKGLKPFMQARYAFSQVLELSAMLCACVNDRSACEYIAEGGYPRSNLDKGFYAFEIKPPVGDDTILKCRQRLANAILHYHANGVCEAFLSGDRGFSDRHSS